MNIKLESDLHLNFHTHNPLHLEDIDVYILAGDIGEGTKGLEYCKPLLEKHKDLHIIYVCGNHEYYHNNVDKLNKLLKEVEVERFHFLQDSSVTIHNVKFIGSTLWTNYNNRNPLDIVNAWRAMNDFKYIKCKYSEEMSNRITPYEIIKRHDKSVNYIFNELDNTDFQNIVITHHKPYLSSSSNLFGAYESDLTKQLNNCTNPPEYWFYGHTHLSDNKSFGFENGDIRFMANCKGYPNERHCDFNEQFNIEI